MISRRLLISAAGATAATASVRAWGQGEPVRLRLASYLAPTSHTYSRILNPWADAIEKEADGAIVFDRFNGGSLGRSPYIQFDLVRAGVPHIAYAQPNYTSGQFPQLQILETPFLVRSATEASLLGWELCERGLVDGFDDVKLLGLWSAEPGLLFMRVPITGFDDLKNLKIRSAGRLEGEFLESLGATAESMHPADVYEAMRRHTIHGSVQGLVAAQTFQGFRVTTHVFNISFGVVMFALMMHRPTWESLPAAVQAIFERHSGQALGILGGGSYDRRVEEIDARFRGLGSITY
ncbi:MAG: TRAP transporter substrate-binding protein DctP, partial [Rhodobacteraceae bacterium]|nr:TRAP transporter substrate-binding protein DctP [Paracoccaceae bacterium]